MMAVHVTLNIGLSSCQVGEYTRPVGEYNEVREAIRVGTRKAAAFKWLAGLGYDFYVEDRSNPVLDRGTEPCVVAVLFAPIMLDPSFTSAVHELCDEIWQSCIAVKFGVPGSPACDQGVLVGPGSSVFGKFDPDKFLNPLRSVA